MADFTVAESEFIRQADTLDLLLDTIDVVSRLAHNETIQVDGADIPHLLPTSKNTMAASAVVLLAAHFEEYVRQQVAEYARALLPDYDFLTDKDREKLVGAYWAAGTGKASRLRPQSFPGWGGHARTLLSGLLEYPVGTNLMGFDANLLCEHDNNMRLGTITELCARVGIKSLTDKMFRHSALKAALACRKKDRFSEELRAKLNEFYELRNSIVHAIAQVRGIGAGTFKQWSALLRMVAQAITLALDAAFVDVTKAITKEKAIAAAAA